MRENLAFESALAGLASILGGGTSGSEVSVALTDAEWREEVIAALKGAYRELFHDAQPLRIALEHVRKSYSQVPEVLEMVSFVEGSHRGVCRSTSPGS